MDDALQRFQFVQEFTEKIIMNSYKRKLIIPILSAAIFTFIGLRFLNHKRLSKDVSLRMNHVRSERLRQVIKPSKGYDRSWGNSRQHFTTSAIRNKPKLSGSHDYAETWKFHGAFHKDDPGSRKKKARQISDRSYNVQVMTHVLHKDSIQPTVPTNTRGQVQPRTADITKHDDKHDFHLARTDFQSTRKLSEISHKARTDLSSMHKNFQTDQVGISNGHVKTDSEASRMTVTKSYQSKEPHKSIVWSGVFENRSKLQEPSNHVSHGELTYQRNLTANSGRSYRGPEVRVRQVIQETKNQSNPDINHRVHAKDRNHPTHVEGTNPRGVNITTPRTQRGLEAVGRGREHAPSNVQIRSLQDIWRITEATKGPAERSVSHGIPKLRDIWEQSSQARMKEKSGKSRRIEPSFPQGHGHPGKVNLWKERVGVTPRVSRDQTSGLTGSGKTFRYSPGTTRLPPDSLRSKVMGFRFQPESGQKYAVFGVAVQGEDYNYVFPAPLNVRAWRRVGYDCIVLLVGSEQEWISNPVLYYVLTELRRADPIVLFLNTPADNRLAISQISRLFVSNLFDWRGLEDTYVLTTDADIWPLRPGPYEMPRDKLVLSLNSECCGSFRHRGQMYRMRPMCNIGMAVRTWRDVVGPTVNGTWPSSVTQMLTHFQEMFGDVVLRPVVKGENDGWFLDQHMISVKLEQWLHRTAGSVASLLLLPRDTGRDRIDRSFWSPHQVAGRNDVHLLEHLYQPGVWERVKPVLLYMFSENEFLPLDEYRSGFIRMLLSNKIKHS